MKIISGVAALGLLACAFCFQVNGAQINGRIDFGTGQINFDKPLPNATTVTNWNANGTMDTANLATDDFAASLHHVVTLTNNWVFSPSTDTNPLWTVDGFSFELQTVTSVDQSVVHGTFLNVLGSGIITGNNFDPTPASFSFTVTGGGPTDFTFTTDNVTAIPEPSTWVVAALAAFVAVYSQRRRLSHAVKRSAG